jgi:sialate O-acetylesterase
VLFDTLIKPLLPYAITGVIWSQGASDEGAPALRHRLFLSHLIRDWRRSWGQGPFPFLMVSPVGFGSEEGHVVESFLGPSGKPLRAWPWIWEGIGSALSLPMTGTAVATDLGSPEEHGTRQSLLLGRRLALVARHRVYGEEVPDSGPVFRSLTVEGSMARLGFDNPCGGLVIGAPPSGDDRGGISAAPSLRGFALAGADRKWFPATALIKGETVLLSSDAVPHPVAARYDWRSFPLGNLCNKAGLPAGPFRTDGWQP